MQITLDSSDIPQILRYLGYRNTGLTETDERNISEAIELTNSIIKPATVWKLFSLQYETEGILLSPALAPGNRAVLLGESIRKHLNHAKEAVLLCVTIGRDFDVEVEKAMVRNPAFGVTLNACGIQAVEKLADSLQFEIDERLGHKTGIRFSPGYGDLPLSSQRDFIRLLDATRKVGVTLNESFLMNPLKSVTAIAAVTLA
ncbi:MAG: hypothetical protein K6E19_00615 [Lachnospiraceae bacterium]|nr:hypothetical protein [Lachnospiraceae bacterium]